jgi:threonyl-tRNA synthetase
VVPQAVAINQSSRSYWRADTNKDHLMRIYGITFPDTKQMKEYQHRIEEAKKRDHRTLGLAQELFFFHHLSPGSAFFLPHGTRIYNTLTEVRPPIDPP